MAMTLNELTQKLNQNPYGPRTDDQLKSEAENRYASIYNQKKLTAQQNYDTSDLAYQKQLQSLTDTLALNSETLKKETANSIANANRYQVTRGMQRSSYGAANNARLESAGNANLAQLLRQYSTDAGSIESNRTLLAQQLADTLAQYDIDYLNDINAYIDEQKQLDYDRQVAAQQYANDLNIQLFQLNQQYGKSSGGSRSYSYNNNNNNDDNSLWPSLTGTEKQQTVAGLNPTFGVASQSSTSPTTKATQQKLTNAANEKAMAAYLATGSKKTTK